MKKYYQLLLVIVSVVSLVSVIIYRNEYNRLRYVLEVLNFFGKPTDIDNKSCIAIENVTLNANVLNIPVPAWQSLRGSYHIYSAFWNKEHEGGTVKAIAISSTSLVPAFMCNLQIPNQEKPVKGKFSVALLYNKNKKNPYKAYVFSCTVHRDFASPYSVTFYNDSNKVSSSIPVFLNDLAKEDDSILICIAPDNSSRNPTKIVEFLNYYQILGVKKFIIYDNGHVIPRLTSPATGLQITVLPWNTPFDLHDELAKTIIETDCKLRIRNTIDLMAVLNWNELIVPSHHTSLISLIKDTDPLQQMNKFQLPVQDFCIDYEDNEVMSKMQIIFHKLHYRQSDIKVIPLMWTKNYNENDLSIKAFQESAVVLQRYIRCFDTIKSNRLERSSSILRFNTDFIKTPLYKLWISGKIFS